MLLTLIIFRYGSHLILQVTSLYTNNCQAIDLMTRRLLATGQKPVTVGTFFSLGHST